MDVLSAVLLWFSGAFFGVWLSRKALGKSLGDVINGLMGRHERA